VKSSRSPQDDDLKCPLLLFPGSCWAFSTVASVEGIVAIETGKLISLSEQDLVSCDTGKDNQGCEGGLIYPSFGWIMKNGIASEAAYPYTGQDDACLKNKVRFSISIQFMHLMHFKLPLYEHKACL
jgi:hypothetical protein